MFLVFTLVLLVVAIGILVSVYSIFFPFMQNLGNVQHYHTAYYGAISSIERGELALKYRQPGFVGSGGFFSEECYGPLGDCSLLFFAAASSLGRDIDSRTESIPGTGKGNGEIMFAAVDSPNYNALGYTNLETFLLGYDNTQTGNLYYTGGADMVYFSGEWIEGTLRLPPKISGVFGDDDEPMLCDSSKSDCDPDHDGIWDDAVVARSMQGQYAGEGFTLFPTISVFYYSGMHIDDTKDNAIRESLINEGGTLHFTNSYTPVMHGESLIKHNVVGAPASAIEYFPFSDIFQDAHFSGLRLSLGAASLFRTFVGAIYPYLEYQLRFAQEISDRYFTLQGHSRVGEYDVQIILKKPTIPGTVGGDFTVIF